MQCLKAATMSDEALEMFIKMDGKVRKSPETESK
jgi:hypothetical protein